MVRYVNARPRLVELEQCGLFMKVYVCGGSGSRKAKLPSDPAKVSPDLSFCAGIKVCLHFLHTVAVL